MNIVHTLKYFRRHEFTNPDRLSPRLLYMLDHTRALAQLPITITSDYRANDPRFHGEGLAVDFACPDSPSRFTFVEALLRAGFTRLGLYPNHIHADVGDGPTRVLWLGSYHQEDEK